MLPYKRQSKISDSNLEPDNFPPELYDSLDIIFLTKRALREFDRRNNLNPAKRKKSYSEPLPSLARFSRQGGPDITDLRGWPEPEDNPDISDYEPQSSMAGVKNPGAKRVSAYDANFVRIMADHGIYMPDQLFEEREIPTPENIDDIYQVITKRRQSLDLEIFTEEDFQSIKTKFRDVSEACSIGDKGVVRPKPDIWDGIRATAVHTTVENALNRFITPKTSPQYALVAPNFFVEVKSFDGQSIVAERQVLNDGAYGARAMHSLQNFMSAKPSFDNKAYTFSATYINGVLSLYAHHVTRPRADSPNKSPEYWMTRLDAYSMNTHRRAFVGGATAFRNLRELAWRNREDAVQAANARVPDPIEADSSKENSSDSHDERPPPPPSKRRKFSGLTGGEAVLLASGASVLGWGTDIGGSIRIPSHMMGLYGFKPSSVRLPYRGVPVSTEGQEHVPSSVGPLARSLDAIHTAFKSLIELKPWDYDARCAAIPWREDIYQDVINRPLVIGVLFDDEVVRPHPPITRVLRSAVEALKAAGHHIVDWNAQLHAECVQIMDQFYKVDGGEDIRQDVEAGGEPFIEHVQKLVDCGDPISVFQYWQLNKRKWELQQRYLEKWNGIRCVQGDKPVDVVIMPPMPHTSIPHRCSRWVGYTKVWNLLDYPAIVIPGGNVHGQDISDDWSFEPRSVLDEWNKKIWEDNKEVMASLRLPVGVQIIGRKHADEMVLAAAKVIDDVIQVSTSGD
ncbi:hypothetical protein GQX73_g4727 [Xylaria multiplex]|uniref:Uncharacterized protein n=1 Tax=Xylaria multiplex TaxID=323545 RepID=A0A7C8MQE1_9PEZI|nr:hypothetical protein GQX73_g4727 [Xylaria multiplex]